MTDKPEISDAEFTVVSEPMVYARAPYKAGWFDKLFCYALAATALFGLVSSNELSTRVACLIGLVFWAGLPWVAERLSRPVPAREVINFMAQMRYKFRHRD